MFNKRLALVLYSSLFLFFSYSYSANGSLLTDPDGLNVSLFNDGFGNNAFGPDSFTIGFDPGGPFGNTIPGVLPDSSEMKVSFFDSSISFTQLAVLDLASTAGWTMTIDDIDWPSAGEIVGANISFSNYPIVLSVGFTSNSLTIRYDGGESLNIGDLWEATVSFDAILAPEPAFLSMILLGVLGIVYRHKLNRN